MVVLANGRTSDLFDKQKAVLANYLTSEWFILIGDAAMTQNYFNYFLILNYFTTFEAEVAQA